MAGESVESENKTERKAVKIKITKKQITKLLIGIFIVAATFSSITYYYLNFAPTDTVVLDGITITFRQNIREAKNVLVFPPNEDAIFNMLFAASVRNITIAFKPASETENPYYILQEFEIVNKLKFAYLRYSRDITFNAVPVEDYSNLNGTYFNPVIALIHPVYANETSVRFKDNVIFISGKTYKDFDLATIKFLIIALNIKI